MLESPDYFFRVREIDRQATPDYCYVWQFCPFSASWRIVLEGRIAGSALPQPMHAAASLRSSKY